MQERIEQELALLRRRWPNLEYQENGQWVRIPSYALPEGWRPPVIDVAFMIPVQYPGAPPYGIYAPAGLTYKDTQPDNYVLAPQQPTFGGTWWIFSWQPEPGQWRATGDIVTGSNLFNWVMGFAERFRSGK